MAYLGSTAGRTRAPADSASRRASGASRATTAAPYEGRAATATVDATRSRPRVAGRSYAEEREWARLATFGGGVALGALLGAGIALLFAPAAGEDVRELLLDQARAAGGRVRDRFDDLRSEARYATRRGRRGMKRGLARSGWALEDVLDRSRRRLG